MKIYNSGVVKKRTYWSRNILRAYDWRIVFVLESLIKGKKRSDAVDGHTSCWNTVRTFLNVIYKSSNKTKNIRNAGLLGLPYPTLPYPIRYPILSSLLQITFKYVVLVRVRVRVCVVEMIAAAYHMYNTVDYYVDTKY